MNIIKIINKKKNKEKLSKEEIEYVVSGYVNDEIKDYQMAAFLMAVLLNDLDAEETSILTLAMMHSGKVIDLSAISGIKVDKHSTGGVGDKTTLIIAPIIAALGIPVAKMSGRGLGFTGGTIDKLESIPNFETNLTEEEFIKHVNQHKIAIVGQNHDLVPADKKMYALRDVTGTVDSIPLIASSIMSKKLATGSDAILLDVKWGNGAFMQTLEDAETLAQKMIDIGKHLNRDVRVEITNMNQPLGREIGNKNEVLEAIATLDGKGPSDLVELCYSSCETILIQAGKAKNEEEARVLIEEVIENKAALNKFYEFIGLQHGDVAKLKAIDFWTPKYKYEVKATEDGFMNIKSALIFGEVSSELGAGRLTKESPIDFEAGITINKKTNELVQNGDVIFTLYSSNPIAPKLAEKLDKAYEIVKKINNTPIVTRRMK
ncbi:thymidine phosphorylase [Candidatus Mycoplasma pogonae]